MTSGTEDHEYSPFAQRAPTSFPVSPSPGGELPPVCRPPEMDSNNSHRALHNWISDAALSQTVSSGRAAFDNANMDVSDSDSDDASVSPSSYRTSNVSPSRADGREPASVHPARGARSASPHFHNKHSLSAVDDVTIHLTVTFTNDVLEPEAHEVSLRRLAAALITSICRRLTVSERRFKVAQCVGKSTIVLDIYPYYVLSPSQAGAVMSASQLGRKIVSLSRSDHGWVATMKLEPRVAACGYGIQADVICVEMSAAEAAALREQQMNDLSPSASESSTPGGSNDKTVFPEPKTRDSVGDAAFDAHCAASHTAPSMPGPLPLADVSTSALCSDDDVRDDMTSSRTSSRQNTPRSFAARHTPRISVHVESVQNLPSLHHLPLYVSRPFVTVSICSPDGDLTVCTKCVERSGRPVSANSRGSSEDDSVYHSGDADVADWHEEFALDVQPHAIYHTTLVIELCERCMRSGQTLVVGRAEPAIRQVDMTHELHGR